MGVRRGGGMELKGGGGYSGNSFFLSLLISLLHLVMKGRSWSDFVILAG